MWFPLESNPEVMNRYLGKLGVKEEKLTFVDVYGVSPELLEMVPGEAHAVLLVYPIDKASEDDLHARTSAQKEEMEGFMSSNKFFYTKQYVGNACGTIALLHALINNYDELGAVEENSVLYMAHQVYLTGSLPEPTSDDEPKTADAPAQDTKISAEDMGNYIAANGALAVAHAEAANEGVTENEALDASIDLHFVCFIQAGDRCVELDGRQANPILHGKCTTPKEFLAAAAAAIQERMDLNKDSFRFGITALVDAASAAEEDQTSNKSEEE